MNTFKTSQNKNLSKKIRLFTGYAKMHQARQILAAFSRQN